uniref:5'-deoxynucleotidase HDDC2 n=1 Tax=Ditylenchus dipsaci TaxID=166011 RepID=A0A915ECV1_9BILA
MMAGNGLEIFELLNILDNLKHLKRTGWVHFNVPEPETVASHMYRMAVLAMSLEQKLPHVNATRCVKMALVHDIAEAIVGDLTPRCGVSEESKFSLEEKALLQIASYVPALTGQEWIALWREYEAATTDEAIVVKQLDKLDMIAQAFTYEQKHGIDLSEFFTSTVNIFKTEPFISWDKQIRDKRSAIVTAKSNKNKQSE